MNKGRTLYQRKIVTEKNNSPFFICSAGLASQDKSNERSVRLLGFCFKE